MKIPAGRGTTGRAVQERRPMAVPDTTIHLADLKEMHQAALEPGQRALLTQAAQRFGAMLAVPLIVKDQVYGAISLYYREPRKFSEEEMGLAVTFADQAALAIENARLHQVEQDRQRELQTLLDVAATASSSLKPGPAGRRYACTAGRGGRSCASATTGVASISRTSRRRAWAWASCGSGPRR